MSSAPKALPEAPDDGGPSAATDGSVRAGLEALEDRPIHEHPAIFEEINDRLVAELRSLDEES